MSKLEIIDLHVDVTTETGPLEILKGVNLVINPGEVHAITGPNGSGKTTLAYAVAGHRHLPEIRQGLSTMAGNPVGLTFVPHLTPLIRGIHATLYARIKTEADFQEVFESRYKAEPFVDVMPSNSHPDTRSVRAANVCRIAVHRPQQGNIVVVLSVIDNLVKGAAGQAVQNMNIMFGLPETEGLWQLAVLP